MPTVCPGAHKAPKPVSPIADGQRERGSSGNGAERELPAVHHRGGDTHPDVLVGQPPRVPVCEQRITSPIVVSLMRQAPEARPEAIVDQGARRRDEAESGLLGAPTEVGVVRSILDSD